MTSTLMYVFVVTHEPDNPRFPPDQLAALLRDRLAGYGELIGELREQIVDPAGVIYQPIEHMLLPSPWYKGRAILIGDAAHATTPHLNQGAAMAIEDAVLLGELIGRDEALAPLLDEFMQRRFDGAQFVVETSDQLATWELEGWTGTKPRDARPGPVARLGDHEAVGSILMAKIVIAHAVTGSAHVASISDALPLTPEKIATQSIDAAEAGAAIIHLDARDPDEGSPMGDPAVYERFLPVIKQRTGAVVNITTGGAITMTVEQRLAARSDSNPKCARSTWARQTRHGGVHAWAPGTTVDGVVERITQPYLITHGEHDRQIPLDAHCGYSQAVHSARRTLRIFTDEEGGVEHCSADNEGPSRDFIADRVAETFSEMVAPTTAGGPVIEE